MPSEKQVKAAVSVAIDSLLQRDAFLLAKDVNERSISHRFAIHLQAEVEQWQEAWDVDCEYNRDFSDTGEPYSKQLDLIEMDSFHVDVHDENATTVYPDVIVHRRGEPVNLLVIEMKKVSAGKDKKDFDQKRKLPAYMRQLDYKFGVFILVKTGDKPDCEVKYIEI